MTIEFERGSAYVVDRGTTRLRTGSGLLQGLDVVIRHFRDALTRKIDNPSQTSGVFTQQYPEEAARLPEAFRNFPILLYQDESGQELCTSCFQCERICPPQVIHMTQAHDPVTGKAVPAVTEFLIEYDACMSCGLCAEVCPFDAIKMDHEFELSTDVHGGLTWNKEQLNRPVSYYEQLAPTFWAEVRDGALKKLQGNVKRRSGLIGVAPQVVGRLNAERRTLNEDAAHSATEAVLNPVAEAVTAPLQAVVPATAPVSVEPAATSAAPVEDKAARLAAIRARNAAKASGEALAPTAVEPADATPGTLPAAAAEAIPSPPSDKAARLAAIRARNAAKAAESATPAEAAPAAAETLLTPAEAASATSRSVPGAADTPPAPAEAQPAPADDKAARLAAIRAKNAAKKAADQSDETKAS
jgi:NADH-quinone oxidoreductase subunit I